MRVGISINDTVRNFDAKVEACHEFYLEELERNKDMSFNDMSNTSLTEGDVYNFDFEKIEAESSGDTTLLKLSVSEDPYLITHRYKFKDKEAYEDFLYNLYAYEIYGRGGVIYEQAMADLNLLYNTLVNLKNQVTVFSQEKQASKQATLLFLSTHKFQGNNIKFLDNYLNVWDVFDMIITSNPLIIASKPEGKICLKIETEYNDIFESEYSQRDLHSTLKWIKKHIK